MDSLTRKNLKEAGVKSTFVHLCTHSRKCKLIASILLDYFYLLARRRYKKPGDQELSKNTTVPNPGQMKFETT